MSYGLLDEARLTVAVGGAAPSAAASPALWLFRDEVVAVPRAGEAVASSDPSARLRDDIAAWNAATPLGAALDLPSVVWVAARERVASARLSADATRITTPEGERAFEVVPKIASNRSYYDASSAAFFGGREVDLRGTREGDRFVARTLWPRAFALNGATRAAVDAATPEAVRALVRRDADGGARAPFAVEQLWQRAGAAAREGKPVLAFVLNGAQGDDDEAHGGHFGVVTGRVGAAGEIDDWLVGNFYSLSHESEKGILASLLPLDNYLADLNSGQSWYRPSYLLVAVLRDDRVARHVHCALARAFEKFYRRQFAYHHARANCTGISVDVLRALGWRVPRVAPEGWTKAIAALPVVAAKMRSVARGKAAFDYLTEEGTRLYPAVAFEQIGADLLALARGTHGRTPSAIEAALAADIDELLLVRIPQFPSSRARGTYPVVSSREYLARMPADPEQQQIIPVAPRVFPPAYANGRAPRELPLRSDVAVLGYVLVLAAVAAWLAARWIG